MLFRSHKPAPPLSDYVENLWLYEGYESTHFQERIFPCGTFELVFNLRSDELRIYNAEHPDRCDRYSGAIISGPYNGYFMSDMAEEASVMGVHFKPGGAFPFLGPAVQELSDSHIDLEAIWGQAANQIFEQLSVPGSAEQRFHILERWLNSRLSRLRARNPAVFLALNALARAGTRCTTRDLARQAGLSEKRFIDLFRMEVGLPPKLFHRVQRFQRVLLSVHRSGRPDWPRLSADYGYFDQSHLIRDFVAFSGFSPEGYLRRLQDLRTQGQHVKFNHLPVSA